jgi:hypothetical protein
MSMRVRHVDAGAVWIGRVGGNGFGAVPEACRDWQCPDENTYVEVDLALRHLACQPITCERRWPCEAPT